MAESAKGEDPRRETGEQAAGSSGGARDTAPVLRDPSKPSGLIRQPRTGREILKRLFLRTIATVVLATAFVYAIDYLVLRYRVWTNHTPFGTVTVHPYYAVPQKDQKTEFILGDATDQQCVNSLFPHMGDSPCWWLTRHTDQRINM